MMGRLSGAQVQLFYAFRLEDRVPSSHLLRQIDAVLDLGDLRRLLTPFYSHTGRPSVHDGRTLYYRSSKLDCDPCALKQRCCPKGPFRRIPRDVNEHGRDHARSLADTQEFEDSSRRRKKIEMLFAHLKRQLGFERLRLRGPSGARDEFLLAATAQNLRRLARFTNQLGCFA
jgi:Transposase DDE domain